MADGDHAADLFAIPDFWKLSSWSHQPPPLAAHDRQDGFFSLDVDGNEPVTFFLGKDEAVTPPPPSLPLRAEPLVKAAVEPVDDGSLFKIPDLLFQMQAAVLPAVEDKDTAVPAPEPEQPPPSTTTTPDAADPTDPTDPTDPLDDIWLFAADHDPRPTAPPEYKSWAAFAHANVPVPAALYGTEQGPLFVDALVAEEEARRTSGDNNNKEKPAGIVLDTHGYCACLLALALGRSSVLFRWDDAKRSFVSLVPSARISGFTAPVLRSVERECVACGNNTRFLRAFVDHTYAAAAAAAAAAASSPTTARIPSRVALARGIDGLLLAIQRELGARGQRAQSLLQLQALVQPVAALVQFVRGVVAKLARAFAAGGQHSDELFLTLLFDEAQSMEYSVAFMRDTIKRLLQLVSAPWLGFVGAWIGLDPHTSKATLWAGDVQQSKSFVRLAWGDGEDDVEFILDDNRMPAFIPDEMRRDMFETGRNLRFLWTNHPEHPLSNMATVARARPPALQWQFDWDAIHALNRQALAYERRTQSRLLGGAARSLPLPVEVDLTHTQKLLNDTPPPPDVLFQVFGRTEDQIQQSLQASMAQLDGPLRRPLEDSGRDNDDDDELAAIVRRQLLRVNEGGAAAAHEADSEPVALDEFAPHWSLLPLLSFGPVVSAQARLVNRACMKLLFSEHGLRAHLRLQKEFQLLGNGMFCSRLAHALFDADRAAAEDRGGTTTAGVQLSSQGVGLRLSSRGSGGGGGGRSTWPPASSELRLALMGLLSQSWSGEEEEPIANRMSFAVRDLSAEEMDRCMDPDALEALDFLRLTYTPPPALAAVMTPGLLDKYDRIFRLLLRVLRMYYVVNELLLWRGGGGGGGKDTKAEESRAAMRFRLESRHFVSNIMAYFWGTGVDVPWHKFEAWLDGVARRLADDAAVAGGGAGSKPSGTGTTDEASPEKLRARHEQVLDEMMLALLLRKRQQPLLVLLEGIFGLILEFAKRDSTADDDDRTTRRIYTSFRKKVAAFIAVCRGLSEKEADSVARKDYQHQQQFQDGSRAGEGSALAQLVLMLDYNGSYSNTRN